MLFLGSNRLRRIPRRSPSSLNNVTYRYTFASRIALRSVDRSISSSTSFGVYIEVPLLSKWYLKSTSLRMLLSSFRKLYSRWLVAEDYDSETCGAMVDAVLEGCITFQTLDLAAMFHTPPLSPHP